jgi:hypothetical protein
MAQQADTRQYPVRSNYHNDQTFSDLRLAYDRIYDLQDKIAALGKGPKGSAPGKAEAGSPSHTKIAGLNVHATPPMQGNQVTSMAGIPQLAYNPASGEIEWYISSPPAG